MPPLAPIVPAQDLGKASRLRTSAISVDRHMPHGGRPIQLANRLDGTQAHSRRVGLCSQIKAAMEWTMAMGLSDGSLSILAMRR